MKTLRRITLGFIFLNPIRKFAFGNKIIASLTGNAFFPTTSPTVNELTDVNKELSDPIAAASSGDKQKIADRKVVEEKWSDMFMSLAYDLMARAKGDEQKLISTGFDLERPKTRGHVPETPMLTSISTANLTGAVEVSCTRRQYATAYQYMYAVANADGSLPPNSEYIPCPIGTRTRQIITNLTRGVAYSIKAAAIGSAGQSPFSDPMVIICQ